MSEPNVIQAYAASGAEKKLAPYQYQPQKLGPHDIEVAITHCGICHSDIHMIDNDWHNSEYPLIPGHEIIGEVTSRGQNVTAIEVGQRVGVGWQRSACYDCELCLSGRDQLCHQREATIIGHHGGFADCIITDSRFAFPIPAQLPSATAAPLLCAGITVYSPLRLFSAGPASHVGVIGVGGLGHLALQFARAFGCEVTAFSHTGSKRNEALSLGADHFVESIDADAMAEASGKIDLLLDTVSANIDWASYLETLAVDGTLCVLGVPSQPITLPAFPLITGRRRVCGSPCGSRHEIREMLSLAARTGVRAQTESFPLEKVNEALDRVRANLARYRIVLETK